MENIWKVHENLIILGPAPCASKNEEITFCRPCLNVARVHTWSLWIVGESCGIHWNWRMFYNFDFVEEEISTEREHSTYLLSAFFYLRDERAEPKYMCQPGRTSFKEDLIIFSFTPCVANAQTRYSSIPLKPPQKEKEYSMGNDIRTAIPRMAIMQSCTCR